MRTSRPAQIIASRGEPLISFTRWYDDCMYGTTRVLASAFPAGRMQRELNRRLKLDLLITAGNVAAAAATMAGRSRSGSYLIKPSFRNSHALSFVIVVISGQPSSPRRLAAFAVSISCARKGHNDACIWRYYPAPHLSANNNFPWIINDIIWLLLESRKHELRPHWQTIDAGSDRFVNTRTDAMPGYWYNMRQYFRFIHEFEDINPVSCFSTRPCLSILQFVAHVSRIKCVRPVSIIRITHVITETHSLNRSVALIDVGVY